MTDEVALTVKGTKNSTTQPGSFAWRDVRYTIKIKPHLWSQLEEKELLKGISGFAATGNLMLIS